MNTTMAAIVHDEMTFIILLMSLIGIMIWGLFGLLTYLTLQHYEFAHSAAEKKSMLKWLLVLGPIGFCFLYVAVFMQWIREHL